MNKKTSDIDDSEESIYLTSKDMPFRLIPPFSEAGGYARVPSLMLFTTKKASYIFLIAETLLRKSSLDLRIISSDQPKVPDDC
jgi:hypothetical protein